MPNYNDSNDNISNPLNMKIKENRFCPICGKDTWGGNIYDNHYKLKLILYNGNPCTQVPERKDLEIDLCFNCRNALYKALKDEIIRLKN